MKIFSLRVLREPENFQFIWCKPENVRFTWRKTGKISVFFLKTGKISRFHSVICGKNIITFEMNINAISSHLVFISKLSECIIEIEPLIRKTSFKVFSRTWKSIEMCYTPLLVNVLKPNFLFRVPCSSSRSYFSSVRSRFL